MYKVFLVDDEIVIREGIRNNMRWDEDGFILCGEAPDSEIALSMIQELKPDILITDIRMPFMDGLELCRRVTRTMPWIHIVILSGYDDFSYAREAISLGVKEYLLKPVSVSELTAVLTRIASNIEQERVQQADINRIRRQLESSSRLLKENCLGSLLDGAKQDEVLAEARKLRMNLLARHYSVMLMEVSDAGKLLYARGVVERFAEGYGGTVHLCQRAGKICVLVMGDTVSDLEERAYAFAQAVRHDVERAGELGIRIAIGASVESLSALAQSLNAAERVLRTMNGHSHRILGSADVDTREDLPSGTPADIIPLYERLQYCGAADVTEALSAYLDSLGGVPLNPALLLGYAAIDILLSAARIVRQSGGDPNEILDARDLAGGAYTRSELIARGTDLVIRALKDRDMRSTSRHSATIRKACQYIEANHQRPEIMLRDVAEHVALSNNHFCTVFGQEMGVTFIEYLTRLRMDKAKERLKNSGQSSAEIAELVGYNDPHYFRYLFKKHTGLNPRDYRASHRR